LFIDLTPGQVAAHSARGCFEDQKWRYRLILRPGERSDNVILGNVTALSVQDVIDRLIIPFPRWRKLDRIGIIRPEGAFPGLSLEDFREKLPGILINWVTLHDLSYGSAIMAHREDVLDSIHPLGWESTVTPMGTVLADGKLVTIMPGFIRLPVEWKVWFTTSRDNQTSVTIRVMMGVKTSDVVKLEGLLPRAKGQAGIKVTISANPFGWTSITAEELGSDLRQTWVLGYIIADDKAIKEYELAENKQTGTVIGKDGIIGELPE
jgi:hypothetical protein